VGNIAVGQEWLLGSQSIGIVLCVILKPDPLLNEDLINIIKRSLGENTKSRHILSAIVQVTDIPRNLS
jgi:acyl-coenzyme A synthetase/AMP-(fatty) acid ligase